MRTYSKFEKLGTVADEKARLKTLAQAIDMEFSLPAAFMDLGGMGRVSTQDGITVIGGKGGQLQVPTEAQVKGYLSTKWSVPGDNPNLVDPTLRVVQFFHSNMPDLDTGYTKIFDQVDMRSSMLDSFDILDANNGITFSQVKSGEKVKIRRVVTDSLMRVPYVTFADGVGIEDDWLRYQKWWMISDTVSEFNNKAWDAKAAWHYDLLTALSTGVNVAYTVSDTQTLNLAAAKILRAVRAKGYGAGPSAGFVIVCAPEDVGRVTKMLSATAGTLQVAYNPNVQPINVHVSEVVASTYIPANVGGYYLCLPGRKMKRGDWKDLTVESERNIYVRANDYVGTFQSNAAIGDTDQVARVMWT